MKSLFILCYLFRHPVTNKVRAMAHPVTFDDADVAAREVVALGDLKQSPCWIVQTQMPAITPKLKLVSEQDQYELVGLDADGNEVTSSRLN